MQEQIVNNLIPFHYEGMALKESCWIDGKPHFTSTAIGEFLGYIRPDIAIHKIISRNPYILQFRTLTKLVRVEGGKNVSRELEIFDPIGLQCIFFESHQPKAIEYKVAAAKLIWDMASGKLKPSKWAQRGYLVSAARQILSLPEGKLLMICVKILHRYYLVFSYYKPHFVASITAERILAAKLTPHNPPIAIIKKYVSPLFINKTFRILCYGL